MTKQIKLFNRSYGLTDGHDGYCHTWYICSDSVQKYFTLPKGYNQVFFTAYTQPNVDRVKIELKGTTIHINGKLHSNWQTQTQDALIKLLKKHGTFYVGCEYE